jgi:alkylation response protein AidB-like acyl-CoA dehydrogenase
MEWQGRKFAAGFGAISLPTQVGGRGLPHDFERAFAGIERGYVVPPSNELFRVTLNLVAPTIAEYGTEALQSTVLHEILTGRVLVCQLFSEPDAGSDLASLRCRARREGDEWVLDGHKVWTSGANMAEYGQLIARTDTAAGHRGLTAFMVPLDLPGITVRPIRQMTGGASFNEVFLDSVRLPDQLRLGDIGQGWEVALATLAFERETSGEHHLEVGGSVERVIELARSLGRHADPTVRNRLADLYIRYRVLELTNQRAAAREEEGPGAIGSIGKLFWTQNMAAMSDVVSMLLGARLTADSGEWGTYAWAEHVLGAPGYRIAGGSDEIQRNIIGERVLLLPREPRLR